MTSTATETIAAKLRRDILSGVFAPGSRLVELQLADRYHCSRAPIRSALVTLRAEGLVEMAANRGATVLYLTVGEAIQITEARAVLEGLMAAKAASVVSAEERTELKSIIEDMHRAVGAEESGTYSTLNALLHRRVREISGHPVAASLVENLRNRAAHHQYRLAMVPGRPAQSAAQHEAIVEAIVSGDPQAAEEAMKSHLASVIDGLRRWEGVEQPPAP